MLSVTAASKALSADIPIPFWWSEETIEFIANYVDTIIPFPQKVWHTTALENSRISHETCRMTILHHCQLKPVADWLSSMAWSLLGFALNSKQKRRILPILGRKWLPSANISRTEGGRDTRFSPVWASFQWIYTLTNRAMRLSKTCAR